jgi:hypothetical protein
MITLLLHLFRLLPFLFGGHRQLALENLALRQQLAVYKRTLPRPKLRTVDRLLWVGLARVWTSWRQALVIVSPDTASLPFLALPGAHEGTAAGWRVGYTAPPTPRTVPRPFGDRWRRREGGKPQTARRTHGPAATAWPVHPAGGEILRRQPAVAMMEAADKGRLNDSAQVGTVHRSRFRGVLVQGEVRPDVVVVGKVISQQPTQMGLVEHDHMVEALAA